MLERGDYRTKDWTRDTGRPQAACPTCGKTWSQAKLSGEFVCQAGHDYHLCLKHHVAVAGKRDKTKDCTCPTEERP